jgi:hypothetical protein
MYASVRIYKDISDPAEVTRLVHDSPAITEGEVVASG